MKRINLLTEGHGLRYAPAQPISDKTTSHSAWRRGAKSPRRGAGKALGALALIVLLAGGGWWVYQEYGPWGLRLKSLRQSLVGLMPSKLPGAAPSAPTPKPPEAKAPQPPVAAAPSPPPPGVKAAQVGRWYRSDRAYPFSILVASFRKEASAAAFAGSLASAGHPVTVAPTNLGARGRWHRVVLVRYGGSSDARKAAALLKGKKPITDTLVLQLPYSVEVGREREKAAAEAARAALASKGFLTHIFPEAAGPDEMVTFLLLAGAFSSKDQAEAFATTLKQAGLETKVVIP